MFQLLSLSVTCKVFLPITYLGLSIQILQYLAPPLASEAGVPGVVSSARATSSESSASSRRTSSSTLRPLIEVSASMEAAVPIYLGIIDLIKVEKWSRKRNFCENENLIATVCLPFPFSIHRTRENRENRKRGEENEKNI